MAKRPTNDIGGQAVNGRSRDLMAAGRMAERGETFGQPDERHHAAPPAERKRYPKEDLRGMIDKIPEPDNNYPSVLGSVKSFLHGINNVLGATDNAVNGEAFDEEEFIGGVAELGIGATRLNTMAAGAGATASVVSTFGARPAYRTLKSPITKDSVAMREFNTNPPKPDELLDQTWKGMDPKLDLEQQRLDRTGMIENAAVAGDPSVPESMRYLKWIDDKEFSQYEDVNTTLTRLQTEPAYNGKVGDYVKHDKLFDEYPELKDTLIEYQWNPKEPSMGSYDPDVDMITLNYHQLYGQYAQLAGIPRMEDMWSKPDLVEGFQNFVNQTLIHEIQHAVQTKDHLQGFTRGRGSNPRFSWHMALENLAEIDTILRQTPAKGLSPREAKIRNDMRVTYTTMEEIFTNVTGKSPTQFQSLMKDLYGNPGMFWKKPEYQDRWRAAGIPDDKREEFVDRAGYALYRKDLGEVEADFTMGELNSPWGKPVLDSEMVYDPTRNPREQSLVTNNEPDG